MINNALNSDVEFFENLDVDVVDTPAAMPTAPHATPEPKSVSSFLLKFASQFGICLTDTTPDGAPNSVSKINKKVMRIIEEAVTMQNLWFRELGDREYGTGSGIKRVLVHDIIREIRCYMLASSSRRLFAVSHKAINRPIERYWNTFWHTTTCNY